jgi:hypothetical protein
VAIDHDTNAIVFQGNLYWAGGRPFRTVGSKTCDSLEAWRKAGKEMIDSKAVGLFEDPLLNLAGPRGRAGDLTLPGRLTRFQPPAGSPVVDAGIDLRAAFGLDHGGLDFVKTNTPVGNAPDIGAMERRNRDLEK